MQDTHTSVELLPCVQPVYRRRRKERMGEGGDEACAPLLYLGWRVFLHRSMQRSGTPVDIIRAVACKGLLACLCNNCHLGLRLRFRLLHMFHTSTQHASTPQIHSLRLTLKCSAQANRGPVNASTRMRATCSLAAMRASATLPGSGVPHLRHNWYMLVAGLSVVLLHLSTWIALSSEVFMLAPHMHKRRTLRGTETSAHNSRTCLLPSAHVHSNRGSCLAARGPLCWRCGSACGLGSQCVQRHTRMHVR
eukprot:122987-Chlamydomonas_euryale.AAC.4